MPWDELKEAMKKEFFPEHELKQLEIEFWELKQNDGDNSTYSNCFKEFSLLVPNLVTPVSRVIRKYEYLKCTDRVPSPTGLFGKHLNVRVVIVQGTLGNFQFINTSIQALLGRPDSNYYTHDINSSLNYYKHLKTKNLHALIINGDHDMTFPYISTKQWISSLKLRVDSPWKPWFIRTQVAGYEKTYSEAKFSLKYATIKGAGHSAAIYKPEESMVVVETACFSY
ncbi:putative serine carboxypeptidase-like 52 [Bidens hawaiensis]|uniref:putative serine carboxypeptidase-like 52 n=1 Tax=Bidens hawaiensis TaxID=980011 RepID=UPI0040499D4C